MISKSIVSLMVLFLTVSSFAASVRADSVLALDQAAAGQPLTRTASGIDIYPSVASQDGENHYIHLSKSTKDSSRWVFQYCREGLPIALARQNLFPKDRDCYLTIGDADGYTSGELQAEIDLMKKQADAQSTSSELSSIGSGLITAVAVLAVMNVVEAVGTGGTANAPTDAAAVAIGGSAFRAALLRAFGPAALKQILRSGINTLVSSGVGTAVAEVFSSKLAQANTQVTNDNAFSSPQEMDAVADQVSNLLDKGPVVIVNINIEAFESDLSGVLGKIQ